MKNVILTLYGAGIVGAMVSNYLAVTAFLWPAYGMTAVGVGIVFDAVWLGASCSWIVLRRRDAMTRVMLVGGVVSATAIQFYQGWTEAGAFGQSVIAAGDGENYFMAALAILRHAIMPMLGILCVHALGRDWPLLTATDAVALPDPVALYRPLDGPAVTITREAAREYVAAGVLPPGYETKSALARDLGVHPSRLSEWARTGDAARRNGAGVAT